MCDDSGHLGNQDPRGCRFIHGHPGDGEWRYCQKALPEGARMGDAAHPPYCERHAKRCMGPSSASWLNRFKTAGGTAFGDLTVQTCGPNRHDGQRLPVDLLLKLNGSGALSHD